MVTFRRSFWKMVWTRTRTFSIYLWGVYGHATVVIQGALIWPFWSVIELYFRPCLHLLTKIGSLIFFFLSNFLNINFMTVPHASYNTQYNKLIEPISNEINTINPFVSFFLNTLYVYRTITYCKMYFLSFKPITKK